MAIELTPIGVVHSELTKPSLRAGENGLTLEEGFERAREQHRRVLDLESEVEVFEPYLPLLDGIEGFSHILVLYWPHLLEEKRRGLQKVHPMGRDEFPLTGIFATCSPARPNPVLVTAVRLLGRQGGRLRVRGFEGLNGSPVLDIKPYSPHYMVAQDLALPDWMARIQREMEAVE